jgi:putative CRISPR-associated protein (TIGR02619 family)
LNLHILMIGTSILTNRGWQRGDPIPENKEAIEGVTADPRRASAELNALLPYLDRGQCDRVHLIATDTPEGQYCRDVVGLYLRGRNIETQRGVEPDLLPAESGDPYAAAAYLRDRVFRVAITAHKRGDRVFLNMTGGLKAEVVVASVSATLLTLCDVPVTAYYMHQSMPDPIELPIASLRPENLRRLANDFPPGQQWISLRGPLGDHLRTAEREHYIHVQYNQENQPTSARLNDLARHMVGLFSCLSGPSPS